MFRTVLGESLGTFVLVFLGCGSVAYSILISSLSLFTIASVWGFAVILGILISQKLSQSHLNPAVTIGFILNGSTPLKSLWAYFFGQFIGAFSAAFVLFKVFHSNILKLENGTFSLQTAQIFGEFYPNPSNTQLSSLNMPAAFLLEFFGTFALMLLILILSKIEQIKGLLKTLFIGIGLALLIFSIAPYTQAGFNPARDFAPRLMSYFVGYGDVAFTGSPAKLLFVYVLAPFLGAGCSSIIFRLSLELRGEGSRINQVRKGINE